MREKGTLLTQTMIEFFAPIENQRILKAQEKVSDQTEYFQPYQASLTNERVN